METFLPWAIACVFGLLGSGEKMWACGDGSGGMGCACIDARPLNYPCYTTPRASLDVCFDGAGACSVLFFDSKVKDISTPGFACYYSSNCSSTCD